MSDLARRHRPYTPAEVSGIIQDLLVRLRGRHSQRGLAKRLGQGSNVVHLWEKGLAVVRWPDFVALCQIGRVDLAKALHTTLSYAGDASRADLLLAHLMGARSVSAVDKQHGLSRHKLSRWLSGEAAPPLLDVFLLIDRLSGYLGDVLGELKAFAPGSALATAAAAKAALYDLLSAHPYLLGLCAQLNVESYASRPHRPGVLGAALGLPLAEERQALALLEQAGLIAFEGGRYVPTRTGLQTNTMPFAQWREQPIYWMDHACKLLRRVEGEAWPGSIVGYRCMPLTSGGAAKLRDLVVSFNQQALEIFRTDSGTPTTVRVLGFQCFDPDQTSGAG